MSWEKLLVALGALAAVTALAILLWPLLRHRVIYPGGVLTEAMAHPSLHGLPDGEEVWLEAEDGVRIHAWWTPARDSARGPSTGAVVYAHGNAETMATRAWIAHRLNRRGFDVLLFDYRGYGLSEGRASEEGLARDARAAWRHVVEERRVAPHRVVLMGHSLGSAVATRLALEVESGEARAGVQADDDGIAALVVGSPFPDMPTVFARHTPWLPAFALNWRTDTHDAGSRLGQVTAPVLVLIGTEDDVIPPALSRRVVEAAREAAGTAGTGAPQVVTAPTDHASLMAHDRVWRALEAFLPDGD